MTEPSNSSQNEPAANEPAADGSGSAQLSDETVELAHQLFDWAREGQTDRLLAYLDAGAPADLNDSAGNTLLMLAAYHGHADLVRALADHGADVNRLNGNGQAPLAGAIFKAEPDVVATLLELGADPDAGQPSARATAQMFGQTELLDG